MLGSHGDQCRNTRRTFAISATALLSWALGAFCGELAPVSEHIQPSLRLPSASGQTVDLADFAGRAVLVNFWASWCTPCIEEMPSIRRLSEVMRDRPFSVLAVNVGEVPLRARTAARRLRLTFPVPLDQDRAVFGAWRATVLPTTYILDGDGVIRYVARGPLEWDSEQLVRLLEGLTGKAALAASPSDD